jgi:hypothetical protein
MSYILRSVLLLIMLNSTGVAAEWRISERGWKYEFPRDHFSHPDSRRSGGTLLVTSGINQVASLAIN